MKYRLVIAAIAGLAVLILLFANRRTGNPARPIPTASELMDFEITAGPDSYTPDNLWDYINGNAPGYIAYGFREVSTFTATNRDNLLEIVVDVYDMGDSLNAFGIYSLERVTGASAVDIGNEAFQAENALYFWQDKYYVKLTAYEVTPETAESLSAVARTISRKIPEKGTRPILFSVFPQNGSVEQSERYLPQDVLGQVYLAHGYRVAYQYGDHDYQVFLIRGENSTKTRENFEKFRAYVAGAGEINSNELPIGERAFAGADDLNGRVLFAVQGSYLIGVVGLDDLSLAQTIVTEMISRLDELVRTQSG